MYNCFYLFPTDYVETKTIFEHVLNVLAMLLSGLIPYKTNLSIASQTELSSMIVHSHLNNTHRHIFGDRSGLSPPVTLLQTYLDHWA